MVTQIAVIPDDLMRRWIRGEITWEQAALCAIGLAKDAPIDPEAAKDWRAVLSMKGAKE